MVKMYIFVCVSLYCSRSQMTSQRVKNTHPEKCNFIFLYNKNSNGSMKNVWGMKKGNKSAN